MVLSMITIHVKMLQSPDVRAGEIRAGDKYLGVRIMVELRGGSSTGTNASLSSRMFCF